MPLASALVLVAIFVGVLFLLFSPYIRPGPGQGYRPDPNATSVPFSVIAHGMQSTVKERTNYLITSESELRQLWRLIDAPTIPPSVDFDTKVVLAVFAGAKPTAGYDIAVSKVEDGKARNVVLNLSEPGASCLSAQVVTAPYQVIVVPKSSLPLTHADTKTIVSCLY